MIALQVGVEADLDRPAQAHPVRRNGPPVPGAADYIVRALGGARIPQHQVFPARVRWAAVALAVGIHLDVVLPLLHIVAGTGARIDLLRSPQEDAPLDCRSPAQAIGWQWADQRRIGPSQARQ